MTLSDVKKFLDSRNKQLTDTPVKKRPESKKKSRPVVYASCHVTDIQTLRKARKGDESFQPLRHFDESGLHMTNDARKSLFFQHLTEVMNPDDNASQARQRTAEDSTKWALFEQYGPELVEFMTDRRGGLKREFDKVFIT